MQIQNHKEEVPFEHYAEKFRALDPQEASRRTGAAFDPELGTFSVALLGVEYHIAWPEYAISADEPSAMALKSLPCQTFLLRFLLEGRRAEPYSAFKTFREMPWGEMYIQPYTGRCLTRAAFTFGTRVAKFRAACEKMGAQALEHGDAHAPTRAFNWSCCPAMTCRSWSGRATTSLRRRRRSSTPATSRPALRRRIASWRATF